MWTKSALYLAWLSTNDISKQRSNSTPSCSSPIPVLSNKEIKFKLANELRQVHRDFDSFDRVPWGLDGRKKIMEHGACPFSTP